MAKDKKPPVPESSSSGASAPTVATELQSIRQRDFLQEGMLHFVEMLEKNKALVAIVVAVAVFAGIGVVSWEMISAKKEKSAQESFYAIEKEYSAKREKYDQAKFASLSGEKVDDLIKAGKAVAASGDLAQDYGTIIDDLEAFALKNKGTAASAQAALLAAETRLQYQQPERALATLETSAHATKANTLVGALVRMAAGNAQALAGKCDLALKSWEEVLAAKDTSFLHSEAALRAGQCLEKSGDKTKAIEMYRKASSESDRSTSAQTARSLLRALEFGT